MVHPAIDLEGDFNRDQVAGFLEDLVHGLRGGQVELEKDGREMILTPNEGMRLKLKAASDTDREELQFILTWERPVTV